MNNNTNKLQLPFEFSHPSYMSKDDFIVAPCNSEAFAMVEAWPNWSSFATCLYGPQGCGKTHLTNIWADNIAIKTNFPYPIPQIRASRVDFDIPLQLFAKHRCLIVENLSDDINMEAMFHLYNLYRNEGGFLLFTSENAPARMDFSLPDLQSRLNSVAAIAISEPDDELLSALIIKLFMDRQVVISLEVVNYMLVNMQRSFAYAHKLVAEIDNISMAAKRAVSVSMVKEAIAYINAKPQGELF